MTQLGHCVLTNKILGSVLSGQFISTETRIGITFFEFSVRPFPLEHKYVYVYDYAYAYDPYVASGN